jgi:hypothetical protein
VRLPGLLLVTSVAAEIEFVDVTASQVTTDLLEHRSIVGAKLDAESGAHSPSGPILHIRSTLSVKATFTHN